MNCSSDSVPADLEQLPEPFRSTMLDLIQQNQNLTREIAALRKELEQIQELQKTSLNWSLLTNPWMILVTSLGAVLVFAALVILDHELSKSSTQHVFFLSYMVPISAPFAAFLLDRAARLRQASAVQWVIDACVVVLGFVRAFYEVPFISGHALFLTYALLTVRSRLARAIALVVLAQVIYLKFFAWHDNTLFGGMGLGLAAVGLFFLVKPRAQNEPVKA